MKKIIDATYLREVIRILVRKLNILEESEFSCCGITITQCHALVEIGRINKLSLNALAELLNLENSTMSRTVNNLVTKNLVRRDIDPDDRRYLTITLTEDGQKLFSEIETSMEVYYQNIFSQIPVDKRETVLDSIVLLLEAITKNDCCSGNTIHDKKGKNDGI